MFKVRVILEQSHDVEQYGSGVGRNDELSGGMVADCHLDQRENLKSRRLFIEKELDVIRSDLQSQLLYECNVLVLEQFDHLLIITFLLAYLLDLQLNVGQIDFLGGVFRNNFVDRQGVTVAELEVVLE